MGGVKGKMRLGGLGDRSSELWLSFPAVRDKILCCLCNASSYLGTVWQGKRARVTDSDCPSSTFDRERFSKTGNFCNDRK
jgi:hypothetical protein